MEIGVKKSSELASMFIDTASGSLDAIHADKSNKKRERCS